MRRMRCQGGARRWRGGAQPAEGSQSSRHQRCGWGQQVQAAAGAWWALLRSASRLCRVRRRRAGRPLRGPPPHCSGAGQGWRPAAAPAVSEGRHEEMSYGSVAGRLGRRAGAGAGAAAAGCGVAVRARGARQALPWPLQDTPRLTSWGGGDSQHSVSPVEVCSRPALGASARKAVLMAGFARLGRAPSEAGGPSLTAGSAGRNAGPGGRLGVRGQIGKRQRAGAGETNGGRQTGCGGQEWKATRRQPRSAHQQDSIDLTRTL